MPFSDPIADGPVIQRASERALAAGATLAASLDLIGQLRREIDAPIVLFTYVNPVLRMGLEAFVARAADAGVDGVLLLDLPIEESDDMRARARSTRPRSDLSRQPDDDRRAAAGGRPAWAAGFCTRFRGSASPARARRRRDRGAAGRAHRAATSLPVALGFGISRPEHVAEVWRYADAAVVGSALVQVIAARPRPTGGSPATAAERFVRWLKEPEAVA